MFEQHVGGQKDTRVTSQRRSGVLGLVRKAKSDDEIQRGAPPPTNMATSRAGVRALGRANLLICAKEVMSSVGIPGRGYSRDSRPSSGSRRRMHLDPWAECERGSWRNPNVLDLTFLLEFL